MESESQAMYRALAAFQIYRTPAKIRDALLDQQVLEHALAQLDSATMSQLEDRADQLVGQGTTVIAVGDPRFPPQLSVRGRALVPALFCMGNTHLLRDDKVSVSGSRDASGFGIKAASTLADTAAELHLCLVAGDARGVDTAASSRVLERNGSAILVLPEGISRYRPRREALANGDDGRLLVVSQFEPEQKWLPSTAMARNRVICALGKQVVVVEAGEKGGTLAAGREALNQRKPLLVLTNSRQTPPGNQTLISEGGIAVASPAELRTHLQRGDTLGQQGLLL